MAKTGKPNLITRRRFLEYSAGVGALLYANPFLGWHEAEAATKNRKRTFESRLYFFDFSRFDTSRHDLVLVAGKQRVRLSRASKGAIKQARRDHPILHHAPDERLTHLVTLSLPADAVQLCYVQRIERGKKDGSWDMAFVFHHHPVSALKAAHERAHRRAGSGPLKVPVKWSRHGVTPALRRALADPVGESLLQDSTDQATALIAGYPELCCGEPNSAADVQTNIIGTQGQTLDVAYALEDQGPATTSGGWATQTPLIDTDDGSPTYGQPYRNSQGQIQYMAAWSDQTLSSVGSAVDPALTVVKDDRTFGANITDIDPTEIVDNDPSEPVNGTLWAVQDGMPTVDQSVSSLLQGSAPVKVDLKNSTPDHGYSVSIQSVDVDSQGRLTLKFKAKNWYVRYLSLYVRYLDANDQPIPLSSLSADYTDFFVYSDLDADGTYDAFVDLLGPQIVFLGMPISTESVTRTIVIPPEAASVMILAGGMGVGDEPYPATTEPGVAMTAIFNLATPSLMLSLAAASGYAGLMKSLESTEAIRAVLPAAFIVVSDTIALLEYDDPSQFVQTAILLGAKLLSPVAGVICEEVAAAILDGETIEAITDAIPVIGLFLNALAALHVAVGLLETSTEVANSPKNYINKISFTHDLSVTISHDVNDPAGFPATATYYTLTATFDGGTPRSSGRVEMPGTTVTAPITYVFPDVPAGGSVKVDVGFYSATNDLVGRGSVGPVANAASAGVLALAITIEELLVKLTSATKYSHKEIIQLDSSGNHVWHATTTAPPAQDAKCDDVAGEICSWTNITVSTVSASVGYSWQAYGSACIPANSKGQVDSFANLSITQNPQASYLASSCGLNGAVRMVYDLMGKTERNFYLDPTSFRFHLRQIRLSPGQATTYDSPSSNKSFGRLRFPSDGLLLHPAGQIISVNTSLNKIEVLELPPAAVSDADAPISQVRGGFGIREGLMDGPSCIALSAQGNILVLEQNNNRIAAFDTGGNPVPQFRQRSYFVPLHDQPGVATYLDLAVEYTGYMYVLSYTGFAPATYHLDIYQPDGTWLARTTGVNAAKLGVNYWRDLFTLNYGVLKLPNGSLPAGGLAEPSVSHWIPST